MAKKVWPPSEEKQRFPLPGGSFQTLTVVKRSYVYSSRPSPTYPILAQNPCSISNTCITNKPWFFKNSGTWVYPQVANVLGSKEFLDLRNETYAKLDRKTFSEVSSRKMELGLLLLERKKTADLIYQTAKGAEQLVRKYGIGQERVKKALGKSKPFSKKARRLSRKLASMQLAFSYGWAPLAQELHALATSFGKGDLVGYIKTPMRSTTNLKLADSTADTSVDISIFTKYFLTLKVTDPMLLLASEFGLTNPATVAWEVTPWSFAIDWVIPIGDFLAQFDAMAGVSILASQSSLTTGVKYKATSSFRRSSGYRGGEAVEEHRSVQRVLSKGPTYRLPPVNNPFSSFRRALNQISLLISLGIKK